MKDSVTNRADLNTEAEFARERGRMVEYQIVRRGVIDVRVLEALGAVPRHEFVSEGFRHLAYADQPLPIGEGQTISQPFMVAAMTEALELSGSETVLEIGAGSGYQAAVLARLARHVHSIELHESLAREAAARLANFGQNNVTVHCGDGTLGWPAGAPYDAIIVTAAAPRIPPPLLEQLAEGGRLVIPVGNIEEQALLRVRRTGGRTVTETLHYCRFVLLRGRYGWHNPHSS